jgi:chemotaxis protein methyltransferase CheR
MNDSQFRRLLAYFGYRWDGYRRVRKGVLKRVRRHMQETNCRTLDAYIDMLNRDSMQRDACKQLLTVSVSRFFRDLPFWLTLEHHLLPSLLPHDRKPLWIWSAGCAGGEEAYSLAIVVHRLAQRTGRPVPVSLLATDLCAENLNRARRGVYPPSCLREVPASIRSNYFSVARKGGRYTIRARMLLPITWQLHDLLTPPPRNDFSMIFMRNNVLTYHRAPGRWDALTVVLPALQTGGYLVIGAKERLPEPIASLSPLPWHRFVYRKQSPVTSPVAER